MAESESQSETQSESQSESETETQDPNVPEGYKGIYKVSDLSLLSSKPDGKYMLMADLDLNSAEQASISVFRGTLDGNNHTIKGLKQALFQVLEEGTVSNLNLSGVQISGSGDTGALANVIGTGKKKCSYDPEYHDHRKCYRYREYRSTGGCFEGDRCRDLEDR